MDINKSDLARDSRIETDIPAWSIQQKFREIAEGLNDKPAIVSFAASRGQPAGCYTCFLVDKYVVTRSKGDGWLLASRDNVRIVLSQKAYDIYRNFDGNSTLAEIGRREKVSAHRWTCDVINVEFPCSLSQKINCRMVYSGMEGVAKFADYLHTNGFLTIYREKIEEVHQSYAIPFCETEKTGIGSHFDDIQPGRILLLGDKPGTATVGLLYLTSYLLNHGIQAKCLFVNEQYDFTQFQDTLCSVLTQMRPDFVAVSMKWFPHIERVYAIARTVKQFHSDIRIIVGGDTASYFAENVIRNPNIDYVICGDGEEPILQICRGNKSAPNTFYKQNGEVQSPETYITNTEEEAYSLLSLDDIMLNPEMAVFTTFYLPTSKGCAHNCIQCGGNSSIQVNKFHRDPCVMTRPAHVVRQDILQTQKYVTAYMFSICDTIREDHRYYGLIWNNIDLSNHVCAFFSTSIINEDLIKLAADTFRYVRIGIDMCSLSQRHRDKINQQTGGKEQITDTMLFRFMDVCEQFDNCEVDIYTIAGMPLYGEDDIEVENETLKRLMRYRCFRGVEWGRLHAQPGAEIVAKAEKYGWITEAADYASFHFFSRMNQEDDDIYPAMPYYHYPYVYDTDKEKGRKILSHYMQMSEACRKNNRVQTHLITREITYGNLNALSDRLAEALLYKGLQPQENIILYFRDRIYLSIAILAVIKAGGCYIPLDPQFFADNLGQISGDERIFGVLTDIDCSCSKRLDYNSLLEISSLQISLPEGDTNSVLYRIYSSGSTGDPKCISVRQIGVTNYTNWRIANYGIHEQDIILQLLSEAFDGFGANFYSALLSGASLVMPTAVQNRDIPFLQMIFQQMKITHTSLLPFQLEMLMTNDNGALLSVQSLVIAGESCPGDLIKTMKNKYPEALLINEYGPTECSIAATAHIDMNEDVPRNIGKPISNMEIELVDSRGIPAREGEYGEICIKGVGLYVGYGLAINAAQAITPVKYLTKDTAYYDNNGDLIFVGRDERIIKHSGILVSLDMIEDMLAAHPSVIEAAVVQKNVILCSFVVLKPNTDIKEIKQYLASRVPAYSVPEIYHIVDSLPRLQSGKVDYKRLASADDSIIRKESGYDPYEEMLFQLWKDELGHHEFTIDDNFFEIGVNSLMIMKVYNKLNERYPNILSITDLFIHHSVRALAAHLRDKVAPQ